MASTDERDRAKRGIKARHDAIKTLIERHKTEFNELHVRNRVALGLSPRSAGPSKEKRQEQIRRLREQLKKWEQEMDDLGEWE